VYTFFYRRDGHLKRANQWHKRQTQAVVKEQLLSPAATAATAATATATTSVSPTSTPTST